MKLHLFALLFSLLAAPVFAQGYLHPRLDSLRLEVLQEENQKVRQQLAQLSARLQTGTELRETRATAEAIREACTQYQEALSDLYPANPSQYGVGLAVLALSVPAGQQLLPAVAILSCVDAANVQRPPSEEDLDKIRHLAWRLQHSRNPEKIALLKERLIVHQQML